MFKFKPGNVLRRRDRESHENFYELIKITKTSTDDGFQEEYHYDVLSDDDMDVSKKRPSELTDVSNWKEEIEEFYVLSFNPNRIWNDLNV